MYLFKTITNKWIFGDTIKDECPAGIFRVQFDPTYTLVDIRYANDGRYYKQNEPLASFKNSSDVSYTTADDLLLATSGFFAGSTGGNITDSNGNILLPSGTPSKTIVEITRPADTPGTYTAGDAVNTSVASPTLITFANMSIANGGGGFLYLLKAESNMTTLAGQTLRYWFYNDTPTGIVGDHIAFVNSYDNASKRCFYIDLTFDSLLAGSDTVFGQVKLSDEYVTKVTGKDLYSLIQTLTSWVPTSGGKITTSLSVVKLS